MESSDLTRSVEKFKHVYFNWIKTKHPGISRAESDEYIEPFVQLLLMMRVMTDDQIRTVMADLNADVPLTEIFLKYKTDASASTRAQLHDAIFSFGRSR